VNVTGAIDLTHTWCVCLFKLLSAVQLTPHGRSHFDTGEDKQGAAKSVVVNEKMWRERSGVITICVERS
jgi:hypothetical protein